MGEPENKKESRGRMAALEAQTLAASGAKGQNQAAILLIREFGGLLLRYFVRNRVPEAVAEELTSETVCRFVTKPIASACPAEVWLWTVARNALVDWARSARAERHGGLAQGGRVEVELGDEAMLRLLDTTMGHVDLPGWVRECVHKAAELMQRQDPQHAEVLWMVFEDWSAEDIAVFYGAKPGAVSAKEKGAARDRGYRARLAAQTYFKDCRD